MSKLRVLAGTLVVSLAMVGGLKGMEGRGPQDARGNSKAYVDPLIARPVVTVCYGHTATAKLGDVKTPAECDALLLKDLNTIYAPQVAAMLKVPVSQGEFNALVDFAYNVGVAKLRNSTLLSLVNAKRYDEAALEFRRWKYVDGKDCYIPANRCGGIPKRRQWQYAMFVS